jgi:hypothetical protein
MSRPRSQFIQPPSPREEKWKRAAHLGEPKSAKENVEQEQLATFLDGLGLVWYHVLNGAHLKGKRAGKVGSAIAAQRAKKQGLKPGVPDCMIHESPPSWVPGVCICNDSPGYCWMHGNFAAGRSLMFSTMESSRSWCNNLGYDTPIGIAIELKREDATPSAISQEQRDFMNKLARKGWYCFAARGFREAAAELRKLGFGR